MPDSGEGPDRDEPIEIPLSDVLDLHGFRPRDVAEIVRDYLDAAVEAGFTRIRLIHGRGIGVQRAAVRAILARDRRVVDFGDLPGHQGGRGATWAELSADATDPA